MSSPKRVSLKQWHSADQSAATALVATLSDRRRNMQAGGESMHHYRGKNGSHAKGSYSEAFIDQRCLGLNELDSKIEKSLSHLTELIAMVSIIERRRRCYEASKPVTPNDALTPPTTISTLRSRPRRPSIASVAEAVPVVPIIPNDDRAPPITEAVPDEDPPRPQAAETSDEYVLNTTPTASEASLDSEPPMVSQVSILSQTHRKLSGLSLSSAHVPEIVISNKTDMALVHKITKQGRNMCLDELWWVTNESIVFVRVMRLLVLLSVMASLGYSADQELLVPWVRTGLQVGDITFDSIFLLEIFCRFISCPSRRYFCYNMFNILDLCAGVLPPVARAIVGFRIPPESGSRISVRTFLVCCVPTLRIVKLLRSFEAFHLLIRAYRMAIEALPVLLFTLSILVLFFSSILYVIEPPANIGHFGKAIWLTVVTTTTVGYGDTVPTTFFGYIVTTCLTIVSALYMAIPIGIVGNAFSTVWKDRERILLTQRVHDRLSAKGYAAKDVPALFHAFDLDVDGQLNMTEFTDMLRAVDIGFNEDDIRDTFLIFDDDYSGAIDDGEFMRYVFPESYAEIYYSPGPHIDQDVPYYSESSADLPRVDASADTPRVDASKVDVSQVGASL